MHKLPLYGWSNRKLNELGFVGRGKSKHRPRNDASLYGGDYPFIQTGDVKATDLYLTEYSQTYNEKGLLQSKLWDSETLCITIAANIAETAILKIRACFPDSIVGFVADPEKADVRFIKYYIDTIKLKMQNISKGTTQDNLSLDKLLMFDFLVPPPLSQRKIASILSAYDDLIENNIHRIKVLEEMARMIYREWFVNFRFPGHEKLQMVDSPLGMIPEGWEVKSLQEVANIQWGDTSTTKASYVDAGYKAFSASGPDGKLDHFDYDRKGIVLSAIGANCGFTWYVSGKWSCIKNTIRFWASSEISTEFLYFVTLGKDFWPKRGAAQPFISQGDAKAIQIVSPEKSLVDRFTEFATDILSQIETLVNKNQNLRQTRDLLLPKLISGEISV
jgi:type I restriction enzyme S subunit